MLYYLLILCILHRTSSHAALVPHLSPLIPGGVDASCTCEDTRSIFDIFWSCIVTIFACSWLSVHPNIPIPGEGQMKVARRRLETMIWSVIAPELIILWAGRQWVGARRLQKKYKDRGWTKTHGYFIQMGGLMLYDGEEPIGVLSPERFDQLLNEGMIKFPKISEEDIQDRSKGDGLTKTIVLLQTAWFAVQCIARHVQGLVITKVELVTAAFAILNSAMYFLWWNKPLDAQHGVAVHLQRGPELNKPAREISQTSVLEEAVSPVQVALNDRNGHPVSHEDGIDLNRAADKVDNEPTVRPQSSKIYNIVHHMAHAGMGILFRWPAAAVVMILKRIDYMVDSDRFEVGEMRVPTFYAYELTDPSAFETGITIIVPSILAVVFGAIHCIGWFYVADSFPEAVLWRVCSAAITGIPAVLILVEFVFLLDYYDYVQVSKCVKAIGDAVAFILVFSLPVYMVARLGLLIAGFIQFRQFPDGAYNVVVWTNVLPHI